MKMNYSGNRIEIKRILSDLDKFVAGFVKILDGMKIKYVIVSGYVAILFGRTRGTEDIDIFISDMLKGGDSIRVAKKNRAVPNIEIKISKEGETEDRLKAAINGLELFISPIENQIAFKFYLGSEKDVEDAVYLHELFRGKLDTKLLVKKCKELNVLGAMNKYAK